ncbi:hypothetical protein ACH41H_36840 [Streptomyces sp. NPDC020800]|uniref:hypothetical protein n=1 Tax=Streptomyces sp. NPDC020800 TaxID=3365092 RepID=UPI0037B2A83D
MSNEGVGQHTPGEPWCDEAELETSGSLAKGDIEDAGDAARAVRYLFPHGARDFVAFLDGQAVVADHPAVIGFEREDPRMEGTLEVAQRSFR